MNNRIINTKYKNLLILSNRGKYKLPFGDYLRILAFAPNLKFKTIYFVGDKDLLLLSKEHNFIRSIKYSDKKAISSLMEKIFYF